MRGQSYDGASNMSNNRVGVQAQIREKAPLATYIHCSGHCINLVISHSCALPEVRNVLDKLKNCCMFFQSSPKTSGLLDLVVSEGVVEDTTRKALLDLYRTRWALRHIAYQHIYQSYVFLVEALEVIGYKRHTQEYELYSNYDTGNHSEAQQILASIITFEFIAVFMTIYRYLSHLAGITIKLQSTRVDIIAGHDINQSNKQSIRTSITPISPAEARVSGAPNKSVSTSQNPGFGPKPSTGNRVSK